MGSKEPGKTAIFIDGANIGLDSQFSIRGNTGHCIKEDRIDNKPLFSLSGLIDAEKERDEVAMAAESAVKYRKR